MKEKVAIYPGTFDPITNGHLSVVDRALKIFDKLVIAILTNPVKKPLFTLEERIYMIKEAVQNGANIEVDTFDGLLVDYVIQKETNVIVRGLRALSDFEQEFQTALMNRKLNREVQSIFQFHHHQRGCRLQRRCERIGPRTGKSEVKTEIWLLKKT